jgi:hypothetical protein
MNTKNLIYDNEDAGIYIRETRESIIFILDSEEIEKTGKYPKILKKNGVEESARSIKNGRINWEISKSNDLVVKKLGSIVSEDLSDLYTLKEKSPPKISFEERMKNVSASKIKPVAEVVYPKMVWKNESDNLIFVDYSQYCVALFAPSEWESEENSINLSDSENNLFTNSQIMSSLEKTSKCNLKQDPEGNIKALGWSIAKSNGEALDILNKLIVSEEKKDIRNLLTMAKKKEYNNYKKETSAFKSPVAKVENIPLPPPIKKPLDLFFEVYNSLSEDMTFAKEKKLDEFHRGFLGSIKDVDTKIDNIDDENEIVAELILGENKIAIVKILE